jgi:hypothetical protein
MKLLEHTVMIPSMTTPLVIIPFGCVHADDEGHASALWEECLAKIKDTPHCYAIGLGDYKSFARGTYRKHLRGYQADEDSARDLDNLVTREVEAFYKTAIRPIQHKLWGLAEGNHHYTFQDNTTDTQLLCRLAGVPYLEKGSLHRVRLGLQARSSEHKTILKILVHHGDWGGGAMTTGGDLNALENRAVAWDVDVIIAAHTHRKIASVVPTLTIPERGRLVIVEKPKVHIRSGCFTRSYITTCVTYGERRLLKPTAIGWVTLEVKLKQPYDAEEYRRRRLAGSSLATARGARARIRAEFKVSF